jgi:Protein of unknown function (DUF3800)
MMTTSLKLEDTVTGQFESLDSDRVVVRPRVAWIVPHLCGIPKRLRDKRRLMMLRAFFDESGTDPSSPALVMGGFVGSVEEWEKAVDSWEATRTHHPKIDYFKRKEYVSLRGQFQGFLREDADAKVAQLAAVIQSFDLQGFCITVTHEFFTHRNAEISRRMFGSRVYDWAFLFSVIGALEYVCAEVAGDDKVDFIFDERTELNECIPFIRDLKEKGTLPCNHRFGTCIPGDDKILVPLQMADMLAGEFSSSLVTNIAAPSLVHATGKRGFIHIPAPVPEFIPDIQSLHSAARKIVERMDVAKKKYFRDGDRSSDLWNEVQALHLIWNMFEAQLEKLTSGIGMQEIWEEYKRKRKSPENKE